MEYSIKHRDEIPRFLNDLGLHGIGVEVGVLNGENADVILTTWRGKKLYLVDPFGTIQDERYIDKCAEADMRLAATNSVAVSNKHLPRAPILMLPSVAASQLFDDESLDFVYLDAQHHKEAVAEDISHWWPKIKVGGVLSGHDYKNDIRPGIFICEVKEVVDDFCRLHKLMAIITAEDVKSWIVIKQK